MEQCASAVNCQSRHNTIALPSWVAVNRHRMFRVTTHQHRGLQGFLQPPLTMAAWWHGPVAVLSFHQTGLSVGDVEEGTVMTNSLKLIRYRLTCSHLSQVIVEVFLILFQNNGFQFNFLIKLWVLYFQENCVFLTFTSLRMYNKSYKACLKNLTWWKG